MFACDQPVNHKFKLARLEAGGSLTSVSQQPHLTLPRTRSIQIYEESVSERVCVRERERERERDRDR